MDGLQLVGRYVALEEVCYSANGSKPELAGQAVPGLYRLRIACTLANGEQFERSLTVNQHDFEGDVTPFWTALERFEVAEGDAVAIAVKPRLGKNNRVELEPRRIEVVSEQKAARRNGQLAATK